tara:strand:- start:498 stop:734 length:237 start_codon:yes stop_codon:yes gene_type:complete
MITLKVRAIWTLMFGIKTISSIQEKATKSIRASVEKQNKAVEKQSEKIAKAELKLNVASDEARKGNAFIANYNKMFEE